MHFRYLCFIICVVSVFVFANQGIISSSFDLIDYLHSMLQSICILAALGFIVGAFYRYSQYRNDPVQSPFSSVVLMVVCALGLLLLAYIPISGG